MTRLEQLRIHKTFESRSFFWNFRPMPQGDLLLFLDCSKAFRATIGWNAKLSQSAHAQIEAKQYASELQSRGCTRVLRWAIAFKGKEVEVSLRE